MSKIWMISDTHFDDEDIIEYENRPCEVEEMIENWNARVAKKDIVYHLGDVMKEGSSIEKISKIMKQLNGVKVLIMGNHDKYLSTSEWINAGFMWVSPIPVILDEYYILSHEPQYVSMNQPRVNIFGHVHNNPIYKTVSPRSFCVCVERINYRPVEFSAIKDMIYYEN